MNKVGKIILGILFVLVIGGLVGYVVWKSSDKKENDEPKKTPEATISVEEKTWTKEEIAKTVIPFFNQVYGKGYNNVEEMQDESVFWSIVYLLVNELSKEEYPWELAEDITHIPFTTVEKVANDYFGIDDFKYAGDTTFICDDEKQEYRSIGGFGTGPMGPKEKLQITDVKQDGDVYHVTLQGSYTEEDKATGISLVARTIQADVTCNEKMCRPISWSVEENPVK